MYLQILMMAFPHECVVIINHAHLNTGKCSTSILTAGNSNRKESIPDCSSCPHIFRNGINLCSKSRDLEKKNFNLHYIRVLAQ